MTQSRSPGSDGAMTGNAKMLDVFALRDSVVDEYKRFATSFTSIHAPDIREQVGSIYAGNRYWPEPLIQINPGYKRSTDVGALVTHRVLDSGCTDIFGEPCPSTSTRSRRSRSLQTARAVVTTGTGSGKSLCFFIPIVSQVLAHEARARSGDIYPIRRQLPDGRLTSRCPSLRSTEISSLPTS